MVFLQALVNESLQTFGLKILLDLQFFKVFSWQINHSKRHLIDFNRYYDPRLFEEAVIDNPIEPVSVNSLLISEEKP